jgi:DNA-binding NarL/FixJ family response regulator
MNSTRIVLVDDHTLVREGLKQLLEKQPDIELVGEASNGEEAIAVLAKVRPDVALMDLSMPTLSGIDATRRVHECSPETKVLALTVHEGEGYVREFLKAGARGYLLKRATTEELVRAIRIVGAGGIYVDPRVSGTLVENMIEPERGAATRVLDLSERETDVLRRIALGYANKEIANQLNLSVKSIETYRARAMEKLGLRDRVDIVRLATERGWFST